MNAWRCRPEETPFVDKKWRWHVPEHHQDPSSDADVSVKLTTFPTRDFISDFAPGLPDMFGWHGVTVSTVLVMEL